MGTTSRLPGAYVIPGTGVGIVMKPPGSIGAKGIAGVGMAMAGVGAPPVAPCPAAGVQNLQWARQLSSAHGR